MTDTVPTETRGVILSALQCTALPDHEHCNAAECPDGQHAPAHCILSEAQRDFVNAFTTPENSDASTLPAPKPYVTQHLVPSPGRMVVVRERAKEMTDGEYGKPIYKVDETQQWDSATNPFALVVGVGPERVNTYGGPPETTDCVEGDKVMVGALGRAVPLVSDGKLDYVYIISFESVVGRLELHCGACGHVERHFAHQAECKECGAGPAPELIPEPESTILTPTLDEIADISAERIERAAK